MSMYGTVGWKVRAGAERLLGREGVGVSTVVHYSHTVLSIVDAKANASGRGSVC